MAARTVHHARSTAQRPPNGGRFVSASAEMKKMTNIGKSGSQCQSRSELVIPSVVPTPVFWALTISVTLSDPTQSSTLMMTKPIETS